MDCNTFYKFEEIIYNKNIKKCIKHQSLYETCKISNDMGVIISNCKNEKRKLYKCLQANNYIGDSHSSSSSTSLNDL